MTAATERQLEDLMFEHADELHERGFIKFHKHIRRQVTLPSGLIIDLISFEVIDNALKFKLIELKRDVINWDALVQLNNYFTEIADCIFNHFDVVEWELILVGSDIDVRFSALSESLSKHVKMYLYSIGFNGISFAEINLPMHFSSSNKDNIAPSNSFLDLMRINELKRQLK